MSNTPYERIKYIEVNSLILDCPIDIERGALILDKTNNRVLLQLKLVNISNQQISSIFINVDSLDDASDHIQGTEILEHSYLDLSLDAQKSFGEKNPIILDKKVRNVKISISKVVFSSGDIWRYDDEKVYIKTTQDKINSLGSELLNVFQLQARSAEINADMFLYLPQQLEGVWACSCGRVNQDSLSSCKRCLVDKNWIFLNTNTDFLFERNEELKEINERKAIEADILERKKNEESMKLNIVKQEKNKKIKKRFIFLSVSFSLFVIVTLLTIKVIIPNNKYNNALELMKNEQYNDSIEVFTEILAYRDSETLIDEAKYLSAVKLKDEGKINEAIESLDTIIHHKDSADLKLEYEYIYAEELYEKGKIDESLELLSQLGNYKNSSNLINQYNYEYGKMMVEKGDIEKALSYLKSDYKDSNMLISKLKTERDYQNAFSLFENGNYKAALPILERLMDYKDSNEILMKARFITGEKLFNSGVFFDAKQLFNKVEGEFDVAKYLNSKYYLIEGNWENLTNNRVESFFHNYGLSNKYKDPNSKYDIHTVYKWDIGKDVLVPDNIDGNPFDRNYKVISIKSDSMELFDIDNRITVKYQRIH